MKQWLIDEHTASQLCVHFIGFVQITRNKCKISLSDYYRLVYIKRIVFDSHHLQLNKHALINI
jgi:hypothetical protein